MSHTKEPWTPLSAYTTTVLLSQTDYARARVCVNACAGIQTEELGELGTVQKVSNRALTLIEHQEKQIADLQAQRDALAAALRQCAKKFRAYEDHHRTNGSFEKAESNAAYAEMAEFSLMEHGADADATKEPQEAPAAEPEIVFEQEFIAKRLRRVARLLNVQTLDSDRSLYDTAGTVLGQCARVIEGRMKPLSEEQIDLIANEGFRSAAGGIYAARVYEFAREIERAHGIGDGA